MATTPARPGYRLLRGQVRVSGGAVRFGGHDPLRVRARPGGARRPPVRLPSPKAGPVAPLVDQLGGELGAYSRHTWAGAGDEKL